MLNDATHRKTWRAWLLLAVAGWTCLAPAAALTCAPGFGLRGPKTRVGDFFPQSVESRQENEPQVADSHQGKVGHGYETASGVHDYVYAHADPVRFSDPSGHMGIGQAMLGLQVAVYVWLMAHPTVVAVGTATLAVINVVMFVVDDEFRAMTLAMPNPGGMLASDLRLLMRTGTNLSKRFVFQFETVVARLSSSASKAAPEAVLYQKLDAQGNHLKFGITKDPVRRYTKAQLNGGSLSELAEGSREEMLKLEAALHKSIPPGPEEAQLFYFEFQAREGIRPPPYDLP